MSGSMKPAIKIKDELKFTTKEKIFITFEPTNVKK